MFSAMQNTGYGQFLIAETHARLKNYKEGLKWLLLSAQNNYAHAQLPLGNIYLEGELGLEKDYNKALEWFKRSAETGDVSAQQKIQEIYEIQKQLANPHSEN